MRKNLTIGGQSVVFECNAVTPIFYKAEFGKDYMAEMLKLSTAMNVLTDPKNAKPEEFDKLDFDVFSRLSWACAKTADRDHTPNYEDWLYENKDFTVMEHGMAVMELIQKNFETKKK